ncbi:16S rRNA (guanine(527)-N(7))-methyltransferase RsmG [Methylophaga sp. OBS1]|uniref:16S rRNA (guanine(527)-N(7))-methyltransferase RsmG n=1 Tax=Methylophaga sp. OBS1 TaxID=2991933 RepID=UPI0022528B66|nr:16S rRNA (guanine(527)-N(7))-methyltransferase RsmG [Methylophaga sp. OBS1]MCX4192497.1 16S rRNA (guanine(527)-N(7))-methyltransferase RsmG [Methylophaga sp. OBS1]
MTLDLKAQLDQGCAALSIDLSEAQKQQQLDYVALLVKWNKVYNLTSVRDPAQMLSRHILDSLSVLPYLDAPSLLDVGTGGGLPGIPAAIVRPDCAVTLLDSNSKKTRFLQQVKAELGLHNVTVVHGRVEQVSLPKFAIITARAFATVDDIIKLAGQHCEQNGRLVLMKGVYPNEELQFDSDAFRLQDVVSLDVPECEGERHLVRLIKNEG